MIAQTEREWARITHNEEMDSVGIFHAMQLHQLKAAHNDQLTNSTRQLTVCQTSPPKVFFYPNERNDFEVVRSAVKFHLLTM